MEDNGDGTATVSCDDGTSVVVGADTSCTVEDNGDGTATITCDDGTSTLVSDTSCTVEDNGDGTALLTCDDGTSVVVGDSTCQMTSNGDGTGQLTCPDGSQVSGSCSVSVASGGSCVDAGTLECDALTDGDVSTNGFLDCETDPGVDGCSGTVVENADVLFDFGAPVSMAGVRFLSDWHIKRPDVYEVWVSDDASDLPGAGATLVATGQGKENPWQCVAYEECDYWTPDACCPNGRDKAQDTTAVGEHHPKHDILAFAPTMGQYWHFRVVNSKDAPRLSLVDLEFLESSCDLSIASLADRYDLTGEDLYGVDLSNTNLQHATGQPLNAGSAVYSNTICPNGVNSDDADGTCVGQGFDASCVGECANTPCLDASFLYGLDESSVVANSVVSATFGNDAVFLTGDNADHSVEGVAGGGAYVFDGPDDHIEAVGPDMGVDDFSISVWVKPDVLARGGLVAQGGGCWAKGYVLDYNAVGTGVVRLETSRGGGGAGTLKTPTNAVPVDQQWHHIAVSVERDATSHIYIDGVSVVTGVVASQSLSRELLTIGGVDPSTCEGLFPFRGSIDNVMLFPSALSSADVQSLYSNPGQCQ